MCKILGQEDIKPHKVRYYLERRDAEFEQKMAQVLCVYREVQVLKKAAAKSKKSAKSAAIVSYDEKPQPSRLGKVADHSGRLDTLRDRRWCQGDRVKNLTARPCHVCTRRRVGQCPT